jgi:hypothetical protein
VKVDSDDQPALSRIDCTGTPALAAAEAAAPLVEWAEYFEQSTPANDSCDLIHLATVDGPTGLCGFRMPTKRLAEFEESRRLSVILM